ncbi:hypothetical protein M0805_007525 [Coniferiporia weirii]|nr:hypothetical protein M0805_007525 [Coniferiporia weirii]
MTRLLNDPSHHILLLQEPFLGFSGLRRSDFNPDGTPIINPPKHPSWTCYLPIADLDSPIKPHVLIYVRTSLPGLRCQPRPDLFRHKDILALDVWFHGFFFRLVNLYNYGPGMQADACRRLISTPPDPLVPTAVCGDFNLHHPLWSYTSDPQSSGSANELVDWLDTAPFFLYNDTTVATHRGNRVSLDSTIDLTLLNHLALSAGHFSAWQAIDDPAYSSDHYPITFSVSPLGPPLVPDDPSPKFRFDASRGPDWTAACALHCPFPLDNPPDLPSADATRDCALSVLSAMSLAISEVMPRTTANPFTFAYWWNRECDAAIAAMRLADDPLTRKLRAADARRTFSRAKKAWAADLLANATTADIYRYAKWSSGSRRTVCPPLSTPEGMVSSPPAQAAVFASTFFPPLSADSDVPEHDPLDRPFPPVPRSFAPLSLSEVDVALAGTSSTSAPGPSGVSYPYLCLLHSSYPSLLLSLFSACLRHGVHPWTSAVIVVIPKPNKPDPSLPRAFRPIALLECMGKLLEKIVATRLTYDCGRFNLVPTNQFGGRSCSSTIDAGLSLVHDTQVAHHRKLCVSGLSLDIKGYFDNVNHRRLLRIMVLLGFPPVGIPQGSPVSPILSSIYTSLILRLLESTSGSALKAYVDDQYILVFTKSFADNILLLQTCFSILHPALRRLGLSTDPGKDELIHYHRHHSIPVPTLSFSFQPPDGPLILVAPSREIRWLGFFLDDLLTFKPHIRRMAMQARSTATTLRILGNTLRGLSIFNFRILYKTLIIPVLTYGFQLWFTGIRQKSHLQPLIVAQNQALRLVAGAFKTSPSSGLHHLLAILPIPFLLRHLLVNSAARLSKLPLTSQVIARLPPAWGPSPSHVPVPVNRLRSTPNHPVSVLHRLTFLSSPQSEPLYPYLAPPWRALPLRHPRLHLPDPPPLTHDVATRRAISRSLAHRLHLLSLDPSNLLIYTDGSRHLVHGATVAISTFAIFYCGRYMDQGHHYYSPTGSSFDAEMFALAKGFHRASLFRLRPIARTVQSLYFISDCAPALTAILSLLPHPAQSSSALFQSLLDPFLQAASTHHAHLVWCPGHMKVPGNEYVDALTRLPPHGRPLFYHTYSALRQEALAAATDMWARTYASDTPHHRSLAGRALPHAPSTSLLSSWKAPASRALQSRAVQVVLGHGHFGAYAARFLPDLPISCPCGAPLQTREHLLLECPLFQHARGPLPVEDRPSAQPPVWGSKLGLGWLFPFLRRTTAFMCAFLHDPLLPPPPPDRYHPP